MEVSLKQVLFSFWNSKNTILNVFLRCHAKTYAMIKISLYSAMRSYCSYFLKLMLQEPCGTKARPRAAKTFSEGFVTNQSIMSLHLQVSHPHNILLCLHVTRICSEVRHISNNQHHI